MEMVRNQMLVFLRTSPLQEYTRELADSALELSKLREFTGREEPSVIT